MHTLPTHDVTRQGIQDRRCSLFDAQDHLQAVQSRLAYLQPAAGSQPLPIRADQLITTITHHAEELETILETVHKRQGK